MVTILLYFLVDNEKNTQGSLAILMTMRMPGAMRRASPNRAQPGLHAEPLNIAIGKLFAPYCPSTSTMVINGGDTTNTIILVSSSPLTRSSYHASEDFDVLKKNELTN